MKVRALLSRSLMQHPIHPPPSNFKPCSNPLAPSSECCCPGTTSTGSGCCCTPLSYNPHPRVQPDTQVRPTPPLECMCARKSMRLRRICAAWRSVKTSCMVRRKGHHRWFSTAAHCHGESPTAQSALLLVTATLPVTQHVTPAGCHCYAPRAVSPCTTGTAGTQVSPWSSLTLTECCQLTCSNQIVAAALPLTL